MRKFLAVSIFILLSSTAFSQWTTLTRPSGATVSSVSAPSPYVVWIACDSTKLFRSTDAGTTWSLRNSGLPTGNLYGISAIDSLNCWVGTVGGSIYRTSNGGSNWTLQFSQSGSFSDGIKMFSLNYGIYYGDPTGLGAPFQIRYTTNGGTNWILSPNAPVSQNDYGVINAWDWIDTSRIWLGAANATSSATSARIFRTTTGIGSGNWSTVTIIGSGTTDGLYWQAIAFIDANSGLAGSNGGNLRRTTDGGATWQLIANPPGLGTVAMVALNAIRDGSGTIRLSTTGGGINKIFRTTNLGANWIEESLPAQGTQNKINHIQFLSQTLGYAGCNGGYVLRFGNPSSVNLVNNATPGKFSLEQNYPNPFNPSTKINFSVPKGSNVTIKVYDLNGKETASLLSEFKEAGNYSLDFIAPANMTSGLYFYKMTAGEFTASKKLMLVK